MNKVIRFAVSAVVAVAVGATAAEVDAPVLSVKRVVPLKWCSLGTSISWYNNNVAVGRFTKGYQTRVLEQIKFSGFINKGVNGGCVNSAIGSVEQADFYTIEHGVNDWGHCVKPGTLDDYENNTGTGTFAGGYRKVIDAIRAKNPNAKIILCTPRKGYGFGNYLPGRCDEQKAGGYFLKDYADVVQAIAKKEGFIVADFFGTCGEQDELAGLSIDVALHPNDAGYQKMANELVKAILKQFPDAKEVSTTFTDDGKPKSVTFDQCLGTSGQIVLSGVDIAKVTVESAKIGGGWVPGGPFDAEVRGLKRDPKTKSITCQIQVRPPDPKGIPPCTRSLLVELYQDDADVSARILWAHYSWKWPVGTDFDNDEHDGNVGIASSLTAGGYVVSSITLGVNKPDKPEVVAPLVQPPEKKAIDNAALVPGDLVFKDNLDKNRRVVVKGAKLSEIELVSAQMDGAWIPNSPFESTVHFITRNAETGKVVCQIQVRPPDNCTRCIAVELSQSENDVAAKILWARYHWTSPVGTDFSKPGSFSGDAPVANAPGAAGYGICGLTFKKRQ